MDFVADILKKIGIILIMTFAFTVVVDLVKSMDKRSPQQKIADQISDLRNKTAVEKDKIFTDCKIVSMSYPIPSMAGMKSVFFKRRDGIVFSALTEHEFGLGEKVSIVIISHRTGPNSESRFLLALPMKN